jgi:hypothetical protein
MHLTTADSGLEDRDVPWCSEGHSIGCRMVVTEVDLGGLGERELAWREGK